MAIRIILEKKNEPLPPKQDKTAVLIIGRFQPPTIGHGKLINAAKKAWREDKYDAVILFVVEGKKTSKDKKKNPLSGESRVFYLENSKYGKGLKFAVVGSAFDAFIKCREMGYEPMAVVGGTFNDDEENRAEGYKKLLDKYFKDQDGGDIDHKAIVLQRDEDSSGIDGVSGSIVRAAVMSGRYEDFQEMVAVEGDLVKQLYDELKAALSEKE
jgi:hypothetical protein